MADQIATRIWSFLNSAIFVLVGASLTSVVLSLLEYAQGLVIGDWSGIHPFRRLVVEIPFRILLASGAAVVVAAAAFFRRYPPITTRQKQIQFGAACGLITLVSFFERWFSQDYVLLLVVAIELIFIFWFRVRLARPNCEIITVRSSE